MIKQRVDGLGPPARWPTLGAGGQRCFSFSARAGGGGATKDSDQTLCGLAHGQENLSRWKLIAITGLDETVQPTFPLQTPTP